MFTNEVVRTAMTGLVAEKGEGHTSYGKYMDPMSGKGACFLGALCEHMGMAIPHEGSRARDVLGKGAVSREMGDAFTVAQALNDAHFEWKYVLLGVDLTLKVSPTLPPCPCGCGASEDFSGILKEVQRQRALDGTKTSLYPRVSAYATGGILTGSIMPTFEPLNVAKITASFSSLSVALTDFGNAFTEASVFFPEGTYANTKAAVKVVTKKDHALVA